MACERVWDDLVHWIGDGRSGLEPRGEREEATAGIVAGAVAPLPKRHFPGGFGDSNHHSSRDKDGEQEGDS